jgi:TctA family transporter
MAILLGGFYVLGLIPGPDMLTKHLSLTFSMVWTIVISNIITVIVSLLFIGYLARLTFIRGNLLIPFILLLVLIGAYTANNDIGDLIVVLVFGGLGYLMVRGGWPRPPLILGFVLGDLFETNLYTCVTLYGAAWLYRPKVIILFILAVCVALYPFLREKHLSKKKERQV